MGLKIFSRITQMLRGSGLRIFPLKDVLKDYTFAKAKADSRAAVNVALLDFPQAMAYALIAGLPVQQTHSYELTAAYDNRTSQPIDVMANLYLYFLEKTFLRPDAITAKKAKDDDT